MTPRKESEAVPEEFARVEPMESYELGVPYFKLLCEKMILTDGYSEEELLEMAGRINEGHRRAVKDAVVKAYEKAALTCKAWTGNHEAVSEIRKLTQEIK